MPKHLLESLTGHGAIYAGDVLLRNTAYDLSLWSDDPPGVPQPARVTSIDGHIDLTGIGEAVVLSGPDVLTLQLRDGRRLRFKLTNTGGAIEGRGELR